MILRLRLIRVDEILKMEADQLVTCPYNPAHRIRKFKLMSHVSKCKKTASKIEEKAECPLDSSHIVDRNRLKEHIAMCPSLGNLVNVQIGYNKTKNVAPAPVLNAYESTENWDEEPEAPPYDPMKASSKRPVIRCVSGLTKSEKKKYRESERERIAKLREFNSPSTVSSSVNDTADEVPLRPPRAVSPTRISQNHNDHAASMQQNNFVPEFHTNLFHQMLYNELAPEDDHMKHLEQSLRNTDTKISLKDYFQHVNKENGNLTIPDKNQKTKCKKTETVATPKLFNVDNNINKKKDECIASTSSVSGERVTDKLLALLKNDSDVNKVQPTEESIKLDQTLNKNSDEKVPTWDEMYSKLNERLNYLTSIQNAAAEESAQLLEQLKEFKLHKE